MNLPSISVIIPTWNERRHIEKCLKAVLNQNYPKNRLEILIIDGMSYDGTRGVIERFANKHKNIRVFDNKKRIASSALNIGIKHAKGKVIARIDAHTIISKDYLKTAIACLKRSNADGVGGLMNSCGNSYITKAISFALNSPLGIGNSLFHYSKKEQYVDTVYMGAYKRRVFKNNLFNETIIRGQDCEFNYRICEKGMRLFMSPKIRSRYYVSVTLSGLARKYFVAGLYKPRILKRHPNFIRTRHLIPSLLVLSLLMSGTTALLISPMPLLVVSLSYLLFLLIASLNISMKEGLRYLPLMPVVLSLIHLSYGVGVLFGLMKN